MSRRTLSLVFSIIVVLSLLVGCAPAQPAQPAAAPAPTQAPARPD